MKMRTNMVTAALAAFLANGTAMAAVTVIPYPAHVAETDGVFAVTPLTPISGDPAAARAFADLTRKLGGPSLKAGTGKGIRFVIDPALSGEAYRIVTDQNGTVVSGGTAAGLFYGGVTLAQMLAQDNALPFGTIDDAPRYGWRGLMIDTSRHFFTVAEIEKIIDGMALTKLNRLHWHLTDDQGWRLEIPGYPKLTTIGAWRKDAFAGDRNGNHGGFYTAADVRRVVAYAKARQIEILPEIDVPGHASAALAAYPEFSAGIAPKTPSADWGVLTRLFNVEEPTFRFLETVIDTVADLFPGKYIHLGGDEAAKDNWKQSPVIQAKIRDLGLKDEEALQGWMLKRLEAHAASRGKTVIGWDEILSAPLPDSATVMSWRGTEGGIAAAKAGHDVIMSPSPDLYFDHVQSARSDEIPGRFGVISLEDVYGFDPLPKALTNDEGKHILGAQANVWTEHLRTADRVEAAAFPRIAALSEVVWSGPGARSYDDFKARAAALLKDYAALGIQASRSAFKAPEPVETLHRANAQLEICNPSLILRLETDDPDKRKRHLINANIFDPCWIWRATPVEKVRTVSVRLDSRPYNFALHHDFLSTVARYPRTKNGELEVLADGCKGDVLGYAPLPDDAKRHNPPPAEITLPAGTGTQDLCFRFTGQGRGLMWGVVDVTLKP